jgi:hypothetical protein
MARHEYFQGHPRRAARECDAATTKIRPGGRFFMEGEVLQDTLRRHGNQPEIFPVFNILGPEARRGQQLSIVRNIRPGVPDEIGQFSCLNALDVVRRSPLVSPERSKIIKVRQSHGMIGRFPSSLSAGIL